MTRHYTAADGLDVLSKLKLLRVACDQTVPTDQILDVFREELDSLLGELCPSCLKDGPCDPGCFCTKCQGTGRVGGLVEVKISADALPCPDGEDDISRLRRIHYSIRSALEIAGWDPTARADDGTPPPTMALFVKSMAERLRELEPHPSAEADRERLLAEIQ